MTPNIVNYIDYKIGHNRYIYLQLLIKVQRTPTKLLGTKRQTIYYFHIKKIEFYLYLFSVPKLNPIHIVFLQCIKHSKLH